MDKAKITAEAGYKIYVDGQLVVLKKDDIVTGWTAQKALEDKVAQRMLDKKALKKTKG